MSVIAWFHQSDAA